MFHPFCNPQRLVRAASFPVEVREPCPSFAHVSSEMDQWILGGGI